MMSIPPRTSRPWLEFDPHLERLRKKTGRIKPAAREPCGSFASRLLPVLCRPSRRLGGLRTTETAAPRNGGSHAGCPQGFLTTRWMNSHPSRSCLLCFLVFWLTSAINRIVKEPTRRHGNYAVASSSVHRGPPIPSAGSSCLLASRPGRATLTSFFHEVNRMLVDQTAKVNDPRVFFRILCEAL